MSRWVVGILATVITALTGLGGVTYATASQTVEVRISAQRLDDGRVEFALLNGQERLLPQRRNFPNNATIDRWLFSSPLEVDSTRNDDELIAEPHSVRITAKQLADGRIEFGLQVELGEEWSETLLPTSRFFPPDASVGRWLRSSPVDILSAREIEIDVPAGVPIQVRDTVILERAELDGWTYNGQEPSFYYSTEVDPISDQVWTYVNKVARTNDDLYDTMRLQIDCRDGEFGVLIWEDGLPYADSRSPLSVTWRADRAEPVSERWHHGADSEDWISPSNEFSNEIQSAESVVVRVRFHSRTLTATFSNLDAMFSTPVQPNLAYCGHY